MRRRWVGATWRGCQSIPHCKAMYYANESHISLIVNHQVEILGYAFLRWVLTPAVQPEIRYILIRSASENGSGR
jgi:hypothetical protein